MKMSNHIRDIFSSTDLLGITMFKKIIFVGYVVGNLVLCRRASRALKRDFRLYIRRYTVPTQMKRRCPVTDIVSKYNF